MDLLSENILKEYLNDPTLLSNLMAYTMITVGLVVAVSLIFWTAEYGRYSKSGSSFGFGINANLAWFLQEAPSVVAILCYYFTAPWFGISIEWGLNVKSLLLTYFLLHYSQRTFIYPLLIRGGKDTPVLIMLMAFTFCAFNGTMQVLGVLATSYSREYLTSAQFILGSVMFFAGMLLNIQSDHILRNLRKPGEKGYKIPVGGLFDYVSAANYFSETLEWIGFAIAAANLPAFALATFTISNLGPRAMQHHEWYRKKFENYPKNRKAYIPFLM